MAVLWIVNTDEDLNIETFDFKQSCFYLSFSVYFDGGSVLIIIIITIIIITDEDLIIETSGF